MMADQEFATNGLI